MGVDYKKQYRPDQLEPFWPNEIFKMGTAVLCTLAVIMFFAVLPVLLELVGLGSLVHVEEPADPHGTTPVGIKPEWYFLASYQYLRLMPTQLLGISGKTLGVLTQGLALLVLMTVPFWYRKNASKRPRLPYTTIVTVAALGVIVLTIWGGWPAEHGEHGEVPVSIAVYLAHKATFFAILALAIIVFVVLMAQEKRTVRKLLYTDEHKEEGET